LFCSLLGGAMIGFMMEDVRQDFCSSWLQILCWEMLPARFGCFVSNVVVRSGYWWHEEKSSWILLHRI
jgi:hypothetical protein